MASCKSASIIIATSCRNFIRGTSGGQEAGGAARSDRGGIQGCCISYFDTIFSQNSAGGREIARGRLRVEIEDPIEHLSSQAREVLRTASLNGTEFRLSTLVHVVDIEFPLDLGSDSVRQSVKRKARCARHWPSKRPKIPIGEFKWNRLIAALQNRDFSNPIRGYLGLEP